MKKTQAVDKVELQVPAELRHLSVISACVRAVLDGGEAAEWSPESRFAVELAVHEACANIIEHAYRGIAGRISITLTIDRPQSLIIVDLHDTGMAFNLEAAPLPNLDEPEESGYGLFLIHQMMDSVDYSPADGDNHWRLVKKLK